jgi:hypothetical protein
MAATMLPKRVISLFSLILTETERGRGFKARMVVVVGIVGQFSARIMFLLYEMMISIVR